MRKAFSILLFLAATASAQPATGTSDMLPLAVGNRWLYSYYHESSTYVEYYSDGIDSGQVEIVVTGVEVYPDSILWHFQETADYRTRLWLHSVGDPVEDSIVHSEMLFDLRESLTNNHALVNLGNSTIFRFVYPYDTTLISRYAVSDSLGLVHYTRPIVRFVSVDYSHNFIFQANTGLDTVHLSTHYFGYGMDTTAAELVHHSLVSVRPSIKQSLPSEFSLSQNYPNPFNPTTTIRYQLPVASHVELTVFNMLGQKVAELVNGEVEAGYHGSVFNAAGLASGVYLYRLTAGSFTQVKRMMLVK